MSGYLLGVLGLPGTGKSTTIREICSIDARLSVLGTDQFHAVGARMAGYISRLKSEGHRVALACQVEGLAQRAVLQRPALRSDCIDEPIEAVLAHSLAMRACGLFQEDEFASWMLLYDVVSNALPQPGLLALLTCDRAERRRRIEDRGRLRDLEVEEEYLDAVENALQVILERSNALVLKVDTTEMRSNEAALIILEKISTWRDGS